MTERATAMYLMPNDYFLKKYQEIHARAGVFNDASLRELANYFDVSFQSAKYRLDECLRPAFPVPLNPLGVMPP
jgi:Zn-dependent peptidase ImmA (M78 family)